MKIIFLDEYSLGPADLTPIKRLGDYTGHQRTHTPQQIIERCADAEIIISNKVVLSRETLSQLPALQLVCIAATGMNNIDLDAAADLGIEVRNAVGYSTYSVAEATMAAALQIVRQNTYYDRFVKSGEYSRSGQLFNFDRTIGQLFGRRWGIIGMGAIGRRVAQLATAFGCEVSYYSPSGAKRNEMWPATETLDELLEQSDILSLHSPLNEHTAGLIGAQQIAKMQRHAILVNVARGGIVDESALAEALNDGTIAAAALDVYGSEPLAEESPLLKIDDSDKLLLTPHNAWSSTNAMDRMIECIAENIATHVAKRR